MGPLLFNIFIHDLFYHVGESLYNFADDNTLSRTNRITSILAQQLYDDGSKTLKWFETNCMKANPHKFQGFTVTDCNDLSLSLDDVNIPLEINIKLLGLNIDNRLNFNDHISKLIKRAAFLISALRRLANYIDSDGLLKLFHAFIRSQFQYANIVWHFTSKASIMKIEKNSKESTQGCSKRSFFII